MLIFALTTLVVISTYSCTDKDIMRDSFTHTLCACISMVSIITDAIVIIASVI